jgi:oxygen-independent coproporphyrinogen III oxidase
MPLPRAAYIHVPFCAHRCGYCDFTLIAGRDDLIGDYLRALQLEILAPLAPTQRGEGLGVRGEPCTHDVRVEDRSFQRLRPESSRPSSEDPLTQTLSPQSRGEGTSELDTLFFGGGTPTHPSCEQLREMFRIVFTRFRLAPGAEVSVEANPLDLSDEKIDVLADAGVNRVSLGVQSFSRSALVLLERDHSPNDIDDVMRRLRRRFGNVSLDLIFGVPGQSLEDWRQTLRRAIELGPAHVSTYGLTWEAGTAFGTRRDRGELAPIDEELERDQYAMAMDELSAAGFEQYEISNFARPGFRCRHNEVYWAGDEYFAFGPGAARYVGGRRETNIRSVLGWLARLERGESPVADEEELPAEHRAKELLFLGLRRCDGMSRADFLRRTGFELDSIAGNAVQTNVARGWLEDDSSTIRLTREGRFVADRVVADFL